MLALVYLSAASAGVAAALAVAGQHPILVGIPAAGAVLGSLTYLRAPIEGGN